MLDYVDVNKQSNPLEEAATATNSSCVTLLEVRPIFVPETARYETKREERFARCNASVHKGTRVLIVYTVLISPHTRVVGMVMKQENLSRLYPCMLSCSSRGRFALRYPVKGLFPERPADPGLAV